MRIIDAHMHLGEDLMFRTDDSEETLLRAMDDNGISAQIVQPGIVARDPERLMLGTDLIGNVPIELAKYRSLGLTESQLAWCLGKTAAAVFGID